MRRVPVFRYFEKSKRSFLTSENTKTFTKSSHFEYVPGFCKKNCRRITQKTSAMPPTDIAKTNVLFAQFFLSLFWCSILLWGCFFFQLSLRFVRFLPSFSIFICLWTFFVAVFVVVSFLFSLSSIFCFSLRDATFRQRSSFLEAFLSSFHGVWSKSFLFHVHSVL